MISLYLSMASTDEDRDKVVFIYKNYYSFMCYTAGQVLSHNKHDVEDAVHNAMLKLIENIGLVDISDRVKVKNLCGIIAKNKAIDHLRRKENCRSAPEGMIPDTAEDCGDPGEIVISRETYDTILDALHSLDPVYRDVCILKYIHRMKEREIAELLDLTPKNVNVRIFRGKQILRDALRKENVRV